MFQADSSDFKGCFCILQLWVVGGGGGVAKQRPWSNSLIIKDLVVSYTFLASRSHFKPISSDFEGGLHFLHLGGGGGGGGEVVEKEDLH